MIRMQNGSLHGGVSSANDYIVCEDLYLDKLPSPLVMKYK